jgi:hypothetical protein
MWRRVKCVEEVGARVVLGPGVDAAGAGSGKRGVGSNRAGSRSISSVAVLGPSRAMAALALALALAVPLASPFFPFAVSAPPPGGGFDGLT